MDIALTAFQFRHCPGRYLHPTQLPAALGLVAETHGQWRQDSSVNGWLLAELDLDDAFAMPAALGGLALYPQPALENVLAALGGVLHGGAMQGLVDRRSQLRLRDALGVQGHRYCLEKWRLIIGPWPPGWQHSLPQGALQAYLPNCGLAFWLGACGPSDAGFVRRLMLRLPVATLQPSWPMDDAQRALARTLCLKVARDRSPECFHLLN